VASFPGATADRDGARYVLTGAPLDVSTSFRPGARFGPDRVRQFARPFDDYDRRTDAAFSESGVHDAGDLRAWPDAREYLSFLRGELSDVAADGAVPLVVGGEHTVTAAGTAAVDPDVLVVVDAHLDLRSAFDGDPWSHACVTRRVLEGGPDEWPASADRAVVVGARTGSREEWERAGGDDVTVVDPADAADWSPSPSLSGERAYLSVDVDGLDPAFAPGTGTMEPFGLTPCEVRDVVRAVAPHAVGFDVVEVNDRDDGQAAALGAKLLREFVYAHAAADGTE
jgi:agmatinase